MSVFRRVLPQSSCPASLAVCHVPDPKRSAGRPPERAAPLSPAGFRFAVHGNTDMPAPDDSSGTVRADEPVVAEDVHARAARRPERAACRVFVAGMHRSGTSLVAGLSAKA